MTCCWECGQPIDGDDDAVIASGDEFLDLLAQAAQVSPHAAQAYQILRDTNPAIPTLETRLRQIETRQKAND